MTQYKTPGSKLGSSQQVVLEYVKSNPGKTTQEVGGALYEKTSSCGHFGGRWDLNKRAANWAGKLLGGLKKLGLISNLDGWRAL